MSVISRYGYDNFLVLIGIGVLLGISAYALRHSGLISIVLGVGAGLIVLFAFWFFRDPERSVPSCHNSSRAVLAPADGRIVEIVETHEKEYLDSPTIRLSIFLSPLDVHVNRYPVSGVVEYVHYHPGQYLVAWHPKSSELNERSSIGVRTAYGKVLFRQITGVLARRIVFETKVGDTICAGARFGMMKFGSRMDVFIPPASTIKVRIGDRVRAGETIIAELP
ncbi:MAG: phosphatidylserine decarboxylase family protein [Bacteroidota bacterium]|nr:phosphatidylserine decarboxylase family protein [Candidatus Kapabacteria bacterium]MCS7302445.1 phosphatidylserine decarboxylase family protein [Candidatus Kapabacteria bacterium]MCX7936334.1 phosphatidylserine decarboxylase family protein [Chlorobiota bacterium]MDW8074385.1 phosphatidylserine decarboxylase family protein [Bacteroidota bacterium]MDW8271139.1 phosphatidylserine decarboxylase family protein [Bacteroidota bacterium]